MWHFAVEVRMRRTTSEPRHPAACVAIMLICLAAAQSDVAIAQLPERVDRILRYVPGDDGETYVEFLVPQAGIELTEFLARLEDETGLRFELGDSVRRDIEAYGPRTVATTTTPRITLERLPDMLWSVLFENDCVLIQFDRHGELEYLIELFRPRYECSGHSRYEVMNARELEESVHHETDARPASTSLWEVSESWFDAVEPRLRRLVDRDRLSCFSHVSMFGLLELQGHPRELARILRRIPESVATREQPDPLQLYR